MTQKRGTSMFAQICLDQNLVRKSSEMETFFSGRDIHNTTNLGGGAFWTQPEQILDQISSRRSGPELPGL